MRANDDENLTRFCLSQPELPGPNNHTIININIDERPGFSFSQPAQLEDLLLCTQLQATHNSQPNQVRNCLFFFDIIIIIIKNII